MIFLGFFGGGYCKFSYAKLLKDAPEWLSSMIAI